MNAANPAYFRLIDLSSVPAPDFVEEISFEEIRALAIAKLLELDPEYTVVESDPAIKVIEVFCYREMLLRQRVNDAARANVITEAVGKDLDVKGAGVNVERIAGEDDDRYMERIQQGFARLAAAGPRGAYAAHTKDVSVAVVDCGVHSPERGKIVVTVLAYQDVDDATEDEARIGAALFAQPTGGATRIVARSNSALLNEIRVKLNEEDIRPMTDMVTVRVPTILEYAISSALVIYPGPDAEAVRLAAKGRLDAYLRSVRKVSYDSTKAGIIAALTAPGVQNVILNNPTADIEAGNYDLAVCTAIDLVVDRVGV